MKRSDLPVLEIAVFVISVDCLIHYIFFVSQLQRDFASGKLHVGLNRLQPQEKTRALYNNVVSLLWRAAMALSWRVRLSLKEERARLQNIRPTKYLT